MNKVYFTSLDSSFAKKLAEIFYTNGYEIATEPVNNIEYFIDTTDARVTGDDISVLDGIDAEAAVEAFRQNVCKPLEKLQRIIPEMTGKRRICFLNSIDASINMSEATTGYGHNMAKAALNQILTIAKNGLLKDGYTFRLFDPMTGRMNASEAAASAYVYFTRDRFDDGPDNPERADENNLIVRDALGREIPW